jgi:glycosyltransferase involved in cell wall biosynthesis
MQRPSLCITLTSPLALNAFLMGHIRRLRRSWNVTVCVNVNESDVRVDLGGEADLHPVEIKREIAPLSDLLAFISLWKFYQSKQFDAVVTVTPKAGLLGMIAARLAQVPVRVHWFTGQVWATKRGLMRVLLKFMDRLIAACATQTLADSASQRAFLIQEGIVDAGKISVLGEGSISGVDTDRFRPDPDARKRIRGELQIPRDAICLLYAGRMRKEKGVLDLVSAFEQLGEEVDHLHLMLVGIDEEDLLSECKGNKLHVVGYTRQTEAYMAAADIICLPSYREGFGSVLLEGAACGLPAVASRIYGVTDAVVENKTGLLHPPQDVAALTDALQRLVLDTDLRLALGKNAYERALGSFKASYVEDLFSRFLGRLFEKRCAQVTPEF